MLAPLAHPARVLTPLEEGFSEGQAVIQVCLS